MKARYKVPLNLIFTAFSSHNPSLIMHCDYFTTFTFLTAVFVNTMYERITFNGSGKLWKWSKQNLLRIDRLTSTMECIFLNGSVSHAGKRPLCSLIAGKVKKLFVCLFHIFSTIYTFILYFSRYQSCLECYLAR